MDDFFQKQGETAEDRVSLVLCNSYEQLPSEAHRNMFFDAALMLHERPAAHLIAVWERESLLDSRLLSRKAGFSYPSWQGKRQVAAAAKARQMFQYLQRLSLIMVEGGEEILTSEALKEEEEKGEEKSASLSGPSYFKLRWALNCAVENTVIIASCAM